jgi:hypothetical protein
MWCVQHEKNIYLITGRTTYLKVVKQAHLPGANPIKLFWNGSLAAVIPLQRGNLKPDSYI